MPFTPEQNKGILDALNQKVLPCSACGQSKTWQLVHEGPVMVPLANSAASPLTSLGTGPVLPCVAVICSNCGNTQFHHILKLGLGPLLGISPTQQGGL